MDRFFKMFSKGTSSNKKEENKAKEEEDLVLPNSLSFEITQLKSNDILNVLVKDIKIGGVLMENIEHYNSSLVKLLEQFNEGINELDYRYSKFCERSEQLPNISKLFFI
jgi:hypothetical protein